jgi:hypothetical protein
MHGNHPQTVTVGLYECDRSFGFPRTFGRDGCTTHTPQAPGSLRGRTRTVHHPAGRACPRRDRRVDWTTWWPWRGAYTRSHPELGREIPQRPWYCVSRHGRVGRRQVFQSTLGASRLPPASLQWRSPGAQTRDHTTTNAGWSSPVARQAHNLKVIGSNPIPATRSSHHRCSVETAVDL